MSLLLQVLEYEYEASMEETYRKNFLKSYKRQIDEAYFSFIIVDAIFDKAKNVEEFWSYGMSKGFQVYVVETQAEVNVCAKRNIHNRSLKDIRQVRHWRHLHVMMNMCTHFTTVTTYL